MAAIILIFLFVNIYFCSGEIKTSICGDAFYLPCKNKYYMEITKAMWTIRKQPTKEDEKIDLQNFIETHADITTEAKALCHNVNTCSAELVKSGPLPSFISEINKVKVISSGKPNINQYLQIKFDFNCLMGQCPHPKFVEKHIIKSGSSPSRYAKIAETKRTTFGQQPTNFMSLFNNAENMEYHRNANNICEFKRAADKFDCTKSGAIWNCKRNGIEIARHNPKEEGHYMPSPHRLFASGIEDAEMKQTIVIDDDGLTADANPAKSNDNPAFGVK